MNNLPTGMTKTPYGWPYMADPFFGLVNYLLKQDDAVEQFFKDTGIEFTPPKNAIEDMIDSATGRKKEMFAKFCDWVVEASWGEEGKCDDIEV